MTNTTDDSNFFKFEIFSGEGGAIGYVTDRRVVVYTWEKKSHVGLVSPTGELLTIYLDITLPALHQEAIKSRTDVFKHARVVKKT